MRATILALALAAIPASMPSPSRAVMPVKGAAADSIGLQHPAEIMRHAAQLMRGGRRDEAVFWFYLGQLRYRAYLSAHPGLDPTGAPALFASLMEVVGRPVNEYAFGDIPALARILNEVLAWDDAHEDRLTPKATFLAERTRIRDGLLSLRNETVRTAAEIRATRLRNGLENRT